MKHAFVNHDEYSYLKSIGYDKDYVPTREQAIAFLIARDQANSRPKIQKTEFKVFWPNLYYVTAGVILMIIGFNAMTNNLLKDVVILVTCILVIYSMVKFKKRFKDRNEDQFV